MSRKQLARRRIRSRHFPGLQVVFYEDQHTDGRRLYSSEIDISAGDRIVIDGQSPEEVEEKTSATLQVALLVRRSSALH